MEEIVAKSTCDLLKQFEEQSSEYADSADAYSTSLRLDLAELIATRLAELGWTQKDLAERTDKPEPYISRLVHSASNCTFQVVGEVLHALGIKPKLVATSEVIYFDTPITVELFQYGEESKILQRIDDKEEPKRLRFGSKGRVTGSKTSRRRNSTDSAGRQRTIQYESGSPYLSGSFALSIAPERGQRSVRSFQVCSNR